VYRYVPRMAALLALSASPLAHSAEVIASFDAVEGITLKETALSGSRRVAVNDRAMAVSPDSAKALVIATGLDGNVEVGADAEVGDVISNGRVFMRDRSCATGDVETDVYQAQNQVEILGDLKTAKKSPAKKVPIRVSNAKVAKAVDPVTLRRVAKVVPPKVATKPEQPDVVELEPATYGEVKVERGATVKLGAGNYVLAKLQMEPGSKLVLDESLGPVNVAVQGSIKWAGKVEHVGSRRPLSMVVAQTSSWINLESELSGSLVAPTASVNLLKSDALHVGSVWAKQVELHQGSVLTRSTPCFEAHCFWENPASTLDLTQQKLLAARARLLQTRQDTLDQLQYDLEDLEAMVDVTTDRGSVVDGPAIDDAAARLKKVASELDDARQAVRSLEALVASRELARAAAMADDATCVADPVVAADVKATTADLGTKLASKVDATAPLDALDPVVEQTEQLLKKVVEQSPDLPRCDLDLASVYANSQAVLKVARKELDDEGLEADDAASELAEAVERARGAVLPSELDAAVDDLVDAVRSAKEAAKAAAKKAAKDQFALQAVLANVPT